jgi:hypothetical protein
MLSRPRWCCFAMKMLELPTAHIYCLHIIAQMCCSTFEVPSAGHRCSRRVGPGDYSVRREGRPGAAKVRRARDPLPSADAVGAVPRS